MKGEKTMNRGCVGNREEGMNVIVCYVPGLCSGEGNGYPLQYSCLENSIDRGAWRATCIPWGHKGSDTTEQLTRKYMILLHNSL